MKVCMSGQKIPLRNRLSSSWNIFRSYQNGIFGNANSAINTHRQLTEIIKTHLKIEPNEAKILEVGCGQTAAQVALFKADGADVTGIDMEIPTYKMNLKIFTKVIRTNGIERALKSLFRHLFFDKQFFSELSLKYGKKVLFNQLDVRVMNASKLLFPDNSFDFIYSRAVFEHIENVHASIREINRVLKPSGIAWIAVHLYPSLSGGHHLDWFNPINSPSKKVPPWDHLLNNKYPVNLYLNRLSLDQYRKIFHKYIHVFDERVRYEGENILTPEIENIIQNKGYTRKDLLTSHVYFFCRKK